MTATPPSCSGLAFAFGTARAVPFPPPCPRAWKTAVDPPRGDPHLFRTPRGISVDPAEALGRVPDRRRICQLHTVPRLCLAAQHGRRWGRAERFDPAIGRSRG